MKVLIAGISTRALAQSAVAAGYQVLSLDFFGDRDQPVLAEVYSLVRNFHHPASLKHLALEAGKLAQSVQAVVIESGLENEGALLGVGRPEQRWFNTAESVRSARDVRQVGIALRPSGLSVPEVILPGEALPEKGRWLVKDGRHSGGQGVRDWDGKSRLRTGEVLEPFIEGDLASACFIADGSHARLVGISRQYAGVRALGARSYLWCGNVAPFWDESLEKVLTSAALELVRTCGLVGLNGIDFILGAKGPVLLEVNPRPPASFELFERLFGVNAFVLHVEACQGRLADIPRPLPGVAWGKAILYAPRRLQVGETRNWPDRGIADVPQAGEVIPRNAPICTLLETASDALTCWERLLEKANQLQTEIRTPGGSTPEDFGN